MIHFREWVHHNTEAYISLKNSHAKVRHSHPCMAAFYYQISPALKYRGYRKRKLENKEIPYFLTTFLGVTFLPAVHC